MLASLCLAALNYSPATVTAQDEAMFARTYKAGEKVTYNMTVTQPGGSVAVDVVFAVQKVLPDGHAALDLRFENIKANFGSTPLPPIKATPMAMQTVANNLPDKFKVEDGNFNVMGFFVMIAGSTLDKKVKAGADGSWTWSGGDLALKGTTKVLAVDLTAKTLKAEIAATATHLGKDPLEVTFTSTFDLTDGSLVSSQGKPSPGSKGGEGVDIKIERAKP